MDDDGQVIHLVFIVARKRSSYQHCQHHTGTGHNEVRSVLTVGSSDWHGLRGKSREKPPTQPMPGTLCPVRAAAATAVHCSVV